MENDSKKLYKTTEGASIGGVCKGFSEVYNLDVSIVRILLVVLTLFTSGIFLVIYFVMYIVLPDKSEVLKDPSSDYTIDEDDYKY